MASSHIDLSSAHWRKSSHSNGDGGECVEVADGLLASSLSGTPRSRAGPPS